VKRGKRIGFDTYNQLACKNCKIASPTVKDQTPTTVS
jgi:hypothetical protein